MNAKIQIAASILNADLGALREAVQRAEAAGVDRMHLDIMDGRFVPNITFGLATVASLRSATTLPFDAHLMVVDPSYWAARFAAAGCETVAIHAEAPEVHTATLKAIRSAGAKAGLAIDPGTPTSALAPYAAHLDFGLVMSVKSGFGGQLYQPEAAARCGELRKLLGPAAPIHLDGGVKAQVAGDAARAGATVLIAGTALFGALSMEEAVRELRAAAAAALGGS
ncbi:MAG: ribulose-phosphate 3-epimerase [Candidatus Limnocylindrus sp.]